jgi:O-antigen ligase
MQTIFYTKFRLFQPHEESAGLPASQQGVYGWCDMLAKFALLFFGIVLWYKMSIYFGYGLLVLAWVLDGGLHRSRQMIKEPLVLAILFFCAVLVLGILWSDYPNSGRIRWNKYIVLTVFIPYLSLLNKERLSWAIGGLAIGYSVVLLMGIYYRFFLGEQGIPPLKMVYLHFSMMLGIGAILISYLAATSSNKKVRGLLWGFAVFLLFMQFNQNARGPLLATVPTLILLLFMLYRTHIKKLLGIIAAMIIVMGAFAYNSNNFHERVSQAQGDIELIQQENYGTSGGYRLAMWDVGLHAIAQRPWFGYGTGMAASAFEQTAETYKGGRYKSLANYQKNMHYHNDWIEMGVYLGALGLFAYAFLLWAWFQTLRAHKLTTLGIALVCFIFLAGLTDVIFIYSQIPSLLLVITAIAIGWKEAELSKVTQTIR